MDLSITNGDFHSHISLPQGIPIKGHKQFLETYDHMDNHGNSLARPSAAPIPAACGSKMTTRRQDQGLLANLAASCEQRSKTLLVDGWLGDYTTLYIYINMYISKYIHLLEIKGDSEIQ